MKVTLKPAWSRTYPMFLVGNVYRVIEYSGEYYLLCNDFGSPSLFLQRAFRVVDATIPPDWLVGVDEDGLPWGMPVELSEPPHFFELYHDGNVDIIRRFRSYLHKLAWDREAATQYPHLYRKLSRRGDDPATPQLAMYELDEDRLPVRCVVFYDNERSEYAAAYYGNIDLPSLPLDPDTDLAAKFVVEDATRSEFEQLFEDTFARDCPD